MPSQEVEFDELLTTIETDYIAPEDYDKDEIRGWCDHIPEDDRGKFEIGYELDPHGFGNQILTQITYIPLTTADEVWFRTDISLDEIVPAPPPMDEPAEGEYYVQEPQDAVPVPPPWDEVAEEEYQAPDEWAEDQDPGPLPELPRGHRRTQAWDYDAEDEGQLPALPPGHRRTGAVLPEGEDLPVGPPGHHRTGALEPTPHDAQLAAQSQVIVEQGVDVPAGPVPDSLHEAIVNPVWWNAYLEYAAERYMAENAQFVADLGGYMSNASWEYFDWMVNLYIRADSSRTININAENRQKLTKLSDETPAASKEDENKPRPGVNVFEAAYAEVYTMLKDDYDGFKKRHGG